MQKVARRVFSLAGLCSLAVLVISACVSVAPIGTMVLDKAITRVMEQDNDSILLYGAGVWMPNTRCFASVWQGYSTSIAGLLIIGTRSLTFGQWSSDREAVDILKRIRFDNVAASGLETLGVNRCFWLGQGESGIDSFSFTGATATFVDSEKTEQGYGLLKAQLPSMK